MRQSRATVGALESRADVPLLRDKAIVITGSTRGLGRAYALAAAREGGRIVVNGRSSRAVDAVVAEIAAEGGVAVGHACDIGDWSAAEGLVSCCVDSFGRLDGFVNNAAVMELQSEPWRHTEDEIRQPLEINTLGTMFCSVAALREMVEQGSGSLVNVASGAVLGVEDRAVYAATKGAIASWTYGLALDLVGTGVRVNALSPTAQTDMSPTVAERPTPESAAPMVVYLLSDLSADLNGQILRISGSRIAVMAPPRYGEPLEAPVWTVETIAEAVRTTLKSQLGIVGLKSSHPEFNG